MNKKDGIKVVGYLNKSHWGGEYNQENKTLLLILMVYVCQSHHHIIYTHLRY